MQNRFRIGTSGWHYKHWIGRFYSVDTRPIDMLQYYAKHFDTVEINNSFYALPSESTVQNWGSKVPEGFCFAVKGSRFITHMKKLKDPEDGIERFFSVFRHLRKKTGPILFQLPPRWKCNPSRLEDFLRALPEDYQYVVEFRDTTWHTEEVYSILRQRNAAFCIYDRNGFVSPMPLTAKFTYMRFHGAAYDGGKYSFPVLEEWSKRMRDWGSVDEIFVYFNNDWQGYAIENAFTFQDLIAEFQPSL